MKLRSLLLVLFLFFQFPATDSSRRHAPLCLRTQKNQPTWLAALIFRSTFLPGTSLFLLAALLSYHQPSQQWTIQTPTSP